MRWDEIRRMQPDAWVLVEALRSHDEGKLWVIDDMALIDSFESEAEAWNTFETLRKEKPGRDFWVLSTMADEPKVEQFVWLGIRVFE